jgi:hypothetical protein
VTKWISFQLTIPARPSVPIWWKVSLTNPCHIVCDFRHWTSCRVATVATVDALFRCDRTSTYSNFKSVVVIGTLTRLRVGRPKNICIFDWVWVSSFPLPPHRLCGPPSLLFDGYPQLCLYNQLFALFHNVFKFLTPENFQKTLKTITLVKTNF